MRILITGAYGFIGSHIVAAVLAAGHTPVCAVRRPRLDTRFPGIASLACDFAHDDDPALWRPRLAGIDAVINCAGLLRERGGETHAKVNEHTPIDLFRACADAGVRKVVQISALGDPADGEFIAAKHRADAALMALDLDWTVLRPSLVYSADGAYGGSSLLRALAALPVTPLPGAGDQRLQPIAAQDVGRAVVAALTVDSARRQCLDLVGPDTLSLRDYLAHWRRWLGLGSARFVPTPKPLARLGAYLGERFGRGPLGMTLWRMLERGQLGARDAGERVRAVLGVVPRTLAQALNARPAHSADRWHARMYLLAPLLRCVLALTWIASGVIGFLLAPATIAALFAPLGLSANTGVVVGWLASGVDIALGLALLFAVAVRPVLVLMALSVLAYTVYIGVWLPTWWLDPFGGLLKNFVILVALAIVAITTERS